MDIKRCFEILEVTESAASSDVERSYLDLLYVWNPKKFLNNSKCHQNVLEKVIQIETAYDRLKQYFLLKEVAAVQSPNATNDDDRHIIVGCVNCGEKSLFKIYTYHLIQKCGNCGFFLFDDRETDGTAGRKLTPYDNPILPHSNL